MKINYKMIEKEEAISGGDKRSEFLENKRAQQIREMRQVVERLEKNESGLDEKGREIIEMMRKAEEHYCLVDEEKELLLAKI